MNQGDSDKKPFVHYLAVWGCISTAIVYAAIGVIAILSFLKIKKGGADESSLLVYLDQFLAGKILIWIILSGMIAYIIWRIYETVRDPYGYGSDWSGIGRRMVTALSSLADALIAFSAIQALLGTAAASASGQPYAERKMVGSLLEKDNGDVYVIIIGGITMLVALVQFIYAFTKGYMERMNIDFLSSWKKNLVHIAGWAGHFARGIILGIIGFFLIKSALSNNVRLVVNTDKAFDFIGDEVGHLYFILVAIGTIAYGIFMFVFGIYYDSDKDHGRKKAEG